MMAETTPTPTLALTTIAERPELVPLVADWLWEAFWRDEGATLAHVTAMVSGATARSGPPQCFVLLADGVPVGTASLAERDLESRPDLDPWLAAVFVHPEARGRGYVNRLVAAVEAAARAADIPTLWLFTNTAERIYAKAGWQRVEEFERLGKINALMRRDLA